MKILERHPHRTVGADFHGQLIQGARAGAGGIGNPAITTADETAGAKLNLADESGGDEEGDTKDDNGSVDVLAKEFKGQRWDADKSVWK